MCKKNQNNNKNWTKKTKNKNKQKTNKPKTNKQTYKEKEKYPQNPEDIKKNTDDILNFRWLHAYPGYNNDEVYTSVCYYRPAMHFYRNTTIAIALYHMAC